jgi:uncharacterized membrane protein
VCELCAAADSLAAMERSSNARAAAVVALLGTGLLAGALFYGWANVAPTFAAVPLDVHLTFRVALMTRNGVVMQALMAISFGAAVWLAVAARGRVGACAAGAAGLTGVTFLVTRFGNVPFNGEMREWAAGALAPDFQQRLQLWGTFNDVRVATAVAAFELLVVAVVLVRMPRAVLAER